MQCLSVGVTGNHASMYACIFTGSFANFFANVKPHKKYKTKRNKKQWRRAKSFYLRGYVCRIHFKRKRHHHHGDHETLMVMVMENDITFSRTGTP